MSPKPQILAHWLRRADSAIDRGVVYKLGRGGFNPKDPRVEWDKGRCDCSGFISWVLQTRRAPKLIRMFWVETTAIWKDATTKQKSFVRIPAPVPGCLVVFPDRRGREGHIGIVSDVISRSVYRVIDCTSKGITEHSGSYFMGRKETIFCVHRDAI